MKALKTISNVRRFVKGIPEGQWPQAYDTQVRMIVVRSMGVVVGGKERLRVIGFLNGVGEIVDEKGNLICGNGARIQSGDFMFDYPQWEKYYTMVEFHEKEIEFSKVGEKVDLSKVSVVSVAR